MKITDLLSKDAIKLNGIANSKQDAINKLVDLMAKNGNLTDKEKYTQVVLKREEEGSTGIGEGIAITSPIPVDPSSSLFNTTCVYF